MTERTMTLYEFTRTTHEPALTEKLGRIVNGAGLVYELTPPEPKTMDEVAFGFNMKDVEFEANANGTTTINYKNTVTVQLGRVSAEEMLQASTTRDFVDKQEEAEAEFDRFPYYSASSRVGPYLSAYMWPRERAWYKARALSLDETSGISTDALEKVDAMYEEAYRLNCAHDVVRSNGANVKTPEHDKSPGGPYLRGDKTGGRGHYRIPILKTRSKAYDIQRNVAVRWSKEHGNYVPFAPPRQERAKDAMRKAAIKNMDRGDDRIRSDAVKNAKETLGRAGVKIPKHTT